MPDVSATIDKAKYPDKVALYKEAMVDAIVATGASIIDMDFFEALGFRHYQGSQFQNDSELRNNYIDRIYDTYIDEEELNKYCTPEGILRLHSDSTIPGCYHVGGSLGNNIGYASGLAYNSDKNVYVMLGDAELYEGSVWETLMFISHHNLNNMRLIVDRNELGILGKTEELLKIEPLEDKFKSFGFDVNVVDGHNFDEMRDVFSKSNKNPEVTIANTVKGKGVSYMEGVWQYHTIIPKQQDDIKTGLEELS